MKCIPYLLRGAQQSLAKLLLPIFRREDYHYYYAYLHPDWDDDVDSVGYSPVSLAYEMEPLQASGEHPSCLLIDRRVGTVAASHRRR